MLEIESLEVMLIWCFFSNKLIRSFFKFSFLISLFKLFTLQFQLHWKNCLFSMNRYHYGSTILFLFRFFSSERYHLLFFRNSHWSCSLKEGVLQNFAKCTGKHLCQRFLFHKVTGLSLALEFCEIFLNTFFKEHLRTTASIFSFAHF